MTAIETEVKVGRYGNPIAEGLPYARGDLIRDTPDDLNKVKRAEMLARKRMDAVSVCPLQFVVDIGILMRILSNQLGALLEPNFTHACRAFLFTTSLV